MMIVNRRMINIQFIVLIFLVTGCNISFNSEGTIELYYPSGKIKERYTTVKGRINGFKTSYFENGKFMKKEEYENGILNGTYKEYFQNGQIKVIGNYKYKKKIGEWKVYDKNGSLVEKTEWDSQKVGFFKKFDLENSTITKGQVNQIGNLEGYCRTYSDGILVDSIRYRNGLLDGKSYSFIREKDLININHFENDKFVELVTINELTLDTFSIRVSIDEKTSYTKSFFPSKMLRSEGTMNDEFDKPIGVWKNYSEYGLLTDSILFDDKGNMMVAYIFDDDGKIIDTIEKKDATVSFKEVKYRWFHPCVRRRRMTNKR